MLTITQYIEEGRRANIALATAAGGLGPIGGVVGLKYKQKEVELIRQLAGGKPWEKLSDIEKQAIKKKFKEQYNKSYTKGALPVIGWFANYQQARDYYKMLDTYEQIKKQKKLSPQEEKKLATRYWKQFAR